MVRGNYPPAHLEAKTPEDLRMLMIANNMRHKKSFHYFDFSFAQGKWHCWYEIKTQDLVQPIKNETDER